MCYNNFMGIIVNKENDKNTDLGRRIDTDLRERLQSTSRSATDPDLADDAEYMKDLEKTGRFGWVWIILIVLAIISLVFILFF